MTQETYNPDEWGVASSNKQKLPLADRNNNPGNLRYANQKKASKGESGFARFDAPVEGFNALKDQVVLDSSRGHTLGSFIKKYAPPSENNTANYLLFIEKELGAKADTLLSTLGVNKISNAIAKFEGGTKLGKQPEKMETYNPDEWSAEPQDKTEAGTYNPDEWSSEPIGSVGKPELEPKSTLNVFAEGISRLPKNLAKETIGLFQGAKGASVVDQGFLDKWYNKVEAENTALSEEAKAGGGKFIPGVSDEAVSSALSSLPYTGLAMAGATAGAAATSPIPIPGARVAGGLVGSHLATNRVTAYAAMNRNLKRLNDLNIQTTGEPITIEQENEFKEVYGSEIGKIADWESIPEAASAVIELAIYGIGAKLPAPIREKAGKLVASLIKNKVAKGVAGNATKLLGTLISETAEEVVSNIGGGNVEAGIWGDKQQEWDVPTVLKTAKEVAPTVAVTAGLVHGAGTIAGKLSKKEKSGDQPKDQKVFADQLNVLSDELLKSNNKLADISTAVGLHSQLAGEPEKQAALDEVITQTVNQGLQDGTLSSDNLSEITKRLSDDEPLVMTLNSLVKPDKVVKESDKVVKELNKVVKEPLKKESKKTGAEVILERIKKDKGVLKEKKPTNAERHQKRIKAAGEIERPSEIIKEKYPDGQTVTMQEIENLLQQKKITGEKDNARIEELSKGTLQMPIDIDIAKGELQDKYKIDKAFNVIETATEKLGGKLAINIVDKNGRPIAPAGIRELSLGEKRNRAAEYMEDGIKKQIENKKVFNDEEDSFKDWKKKAKDKYWSVGLSEDEIFEQWRQTANRLRPKVMIMSDKPIIRTEGQRTLEQIEKEITDRWKKAKTLPPGKKKSQIANEITALNAEMEKTMMAAEGEPRGERVAPERGRVEKALKIPKEKAVEKIKDIETEEIPIGKIKLSKDVPQFKEGADAKGIVEPLKGRYERIGTPPVVLWERKNGDLELITGRHRFDLAQKQGEKTIPAQTIKETDGFTKEQAAIFDAESNIRDEKGSVRDYATYFRETEITEKQASRRGLLSRVKGQDGFIIGRHASNDLYAIYRNKELVENKIVAIAKAVPTNKDLQSVGAKYAFTHSAYETANYLQAVKTITSKATGAQISLFGENESWQIEADKMANVASKMGRALKQERTLLKSASKLDKAKHKEFLDKYGIKPGDTQAINNKILELDEKIGKLDNWAAHSDVVVDIKKQAGIEYEKATEDKTTKVSEPTGGAGLTEKKTGKPKWPKVVSNRRRRYLSHTTHIKNNGDAAAFADYNLSGFPQERLVALLLGEGGEILGAHRFSVGTANQSVVSLGILAGQALNTKGVKEVILVHNHPGGGAMLSDADVNTANAFRNLLAETKINAGTIIAAGEGSYSANNKIVHRTPIIKEATVRVPMMVRRFKTRGENLTVITDDRSARKSGKKLIPKGGLMFLNGANAVVGTMRIDSYLKLRGNYATKILKQAEKINATTMIAFNPTKNSEKIGVNNLKKFANASHLGLLDVIDRKGSLHSIDAMPTESSSIYYETSKTAKTKGRPLTNEDISKTFAKMENVTTGQDKANNFWFRFKGFPKFTILEVDSINDRIGLTDKRLKTGAFLRESKQIWFKTGGVGAKADIGTLHHENWHLFKKMGVISKPDLRAVKRAIRRSGNLGIITEETEASWISEAAKSREYTRNSVIGRILQKIGDFLDAMANLVTTTSRGVMRKMESGKMVTQDADVGHMALSPAMAFETMAKEFGVSPEQLQKEFEETKAKHKGTDQWMKAPNGEPSNLKEHAWVMAQTPRFKEWFGGSKVVDENGEPLVVYHGTSGNFSVFDKSLLGDNTQDWASAKWGFAFTPDEGYAKGYSSAYDRNKDDPTLISAYLSIKNPLKMELYKEYSPIAKNEKVAAKTKKDAITNEHDGIIIYYNDHVTGKYKEYEIFAFNPTQIKSIYNTGAFSQTYPDIRYETAETKDVNLSEEIEEEDTAFQQAIDLISTHWGKQGKYTNERKKLTFLEHHLGTTMYNAKRIGGWYNRFYNVIRNLGQYKFEQQNRLRGEGDASLFAPLETFSKKNKTEYRKLKKYLVNKDIHAEGYKVRPTLEEGALYEGAYDIINEKGTVIDTQTTEDEAFNEVWEMEADATDFTDAGKEALLNFRKMTRNLYKHYAKGMNEIIEMARLSGQPPPKVTTIVGGKPVKISLRQAIQDMGDRQGYYFPRIRESGEWKIEGRKEGMPAKSKFFASKALSKGYAQKLRRQGYKVESTHSGAFSEDLFQTLAPLLAQEQVVNSVIDRVSKNEDFDAVYADMFAKQYAEMLKSHGSRARMIGRSDAIGIDVKRGYETDPVKAIAIATEAAAGGYAKQLIAINAMKAITGRDLSWEEYQKDNPGKKHEDYLKDIRKRGADASRQQTEYKEATETLQDILKNQELADRIVGTLKGMAVVWYLGARVSSAAVNLTNMVIGVPATMVGELSDKASKISFRQAFKHIWNAGIAYGKFRAGKLKNIGQADLFQEIEKRGWDAPQFNMEALNALQNKYGKAWGQVIDKSMWMFGVTEKINRATTIGANYMALCKKNNVRLRDTSGKLNEKLLLKARNASDVAHGVYEKGNRPYHMRGEHIGARVLQMAYVFQTFTHNYLQEMIRLGLVKKQYGAAAYMALSGGVIGGLGATVPIGIAKAIAALFDADDPEEEMIKWAEDAFGGGKLARYGLPGLLGISLKGSLATRFDVPETTLDWFGAPGNVVADIWDGTKNLTKGFYREGFEQIAPVAARNISRGLRESKEGVTTRSGSPVFFGKDRLKGNSYDMVLRWLSFNPTGISEKREIQWNEYKTMGRYKEKRSELYKRYKRFYSKPPGKRNTKDKVDILADIRDFNIEVKRKKISRIVRPITKRSIKQSMRSLKPSKRERER